MKKKIQLFIMIVSIFLIHQNIAIGGSDETVAVIMKKLRCSEKQAKKFMRDVLNTMAVIENSISVIASNYTPRAKRFSIANETIQQYFESRSSKVYRSSVFSNSPTPVYEYFNLLSTSYNGKYEIEIKFTESWLSFGNIQQLYNSKYGKYYDFSIDAWRFNTFDDKVLDNTALIKTQFNFYNNLNSDSWELKVKALVVKETISKKSLEEIWK